ncbi:RodZ domain-containing protein [Frateuria aurantia]
MEAALSSQATEAPQATIGQRLAAAREARGWTIDYCAETLHLPRNVLRKLEADEHLGIDYAIYLRSYITNYGRLLGLSIEAEIPRVQASEPQLVSTGGVSRSRHLLERYARAATYVMFTAVIVVPVAWLGISGALDHNISHLDPLDAAPVAASVAASSEPAASTAQVADATASKPQPLNAPSVVAGVPGLAAAASSPAQPLMASIMPGLEDRSGPAASAAAPVAAPAAGNGVVGAGAHSLDVGLAQASWVEVTAADGKRLAYGLLPADSTKTFRSDQDLTVRIGNASGATVKLDGNPVALDAYRHANVARFRVAVQGGSASATGF